MAAASASTPTAADPAGLLRAVEALLRASGRLEVMRGPGGAIEIRRQGDLRAILRTQVLDDQVSLAILAPICAEAEADPGAMLDAAADLPTGAIALVGGCFVVRIALPAARAATADLEQAIDIAAAAAAALTPSFDAPRQDVAAIFTHYGS
jgi:hypothetical protein